MRDNPNLITNKKKRLIDPSALRPLDLFNVAGKNGSINVHYNKKYQKEERFMDEGEINKSSYSFSSSHHLIVPC